MDSRQLFSLLADAGVSSDNVQQLYSTFRELSRNQTIEIPGLSELNRTLKAVGITEDNIGSKFESYKPSSAPQVDQVKEEKVDKDLNSPEMQILLDDVSKIDLVLKYRKLATKCFSQLADEPEWGHVREEDRKAKWFTYLNNYWAKLERNAARHPEKFQSSQDKDISNTDFSEHGMSLREILLRHLNESDVEQVVNAFNRSENFGQNLDEQGKKINAETYRVINQAFIANRAVLGDFAKDLWKWTMWWFGDVMDRSPFHRGGDRRGPLAIYDNLGHGPEQIADLMKKELAEIEKKHGRFLEKNAKGNFLPEILKSDVVIKTENSYYISAHLIEKEVEEQNKVKLENLTKFADAANEFNNAISEFKIQEKTLREKAKAEEEARLKAEAKEKARAEAEAAAKAKADAEAKAKADEEFKKRVDQRIVELLKQEQKNRDKKRDQINYAMNSRHANHNARLNQENADQKNDELTLITNDLSQLKFDMEKQVKNLKNRSVLTISADARDAKVSTLEKLISLCQAQDLENLEKIAQYITTWMQKDKPTWNDCKFIDELKVYPVRVMYAQGKNGSETAKLINQILPIVNTTKNQIALDRSNLAIRHANVKVTLGMQDKDDLDLCAKLDSEVTSEAIAERKVALRPQAEQQIRSEIEQARLDEIERVEKMERWAREDAARAREREERLERERVQAEQHQQEMRRAAVERQEARARQEQLDRQRAEADRQERVRMEQLERQRVEEARRQREAQQALVLRRQSPISSSSSALLKPAAGAVSSRSDVFSTGFFSPENQARREKEWEDSFKPGGFFSAENNAKRERKFQQFLNKKK